MPAKFTRPDQYYGKLGKAPRDIPDIRARILPAFGVLLLLELLLALSVLWYRHGQNTALEDKQTLYRANEIIAEARQDSLQLGRLLDQVLASPTPENIKAYAALVQKKSAPLVDTPATPNTTLNTLTDLTPSHLKLLIGSISFGEAEWLRFDRVADESAKLRGIDEKALAAFQGEPHADGQAHSETHLPDPGFVVQELLADHSYQARRTRLNEDFAAMQAALDLRILTLLNIETFLSRSFFSTALAALALLLPATAALAWFLHRHEARRHIFHKNQVRRLNDDLSKVRGELSHIQAEHLRPDADRVEE